MNTFDDKKETAAARARRYMSQVDASNKTSYGKSEVKDMLNQIAQTSDAIKVSSADEISCRSPTELTNLRRGDVFIAKNIGGKVRPWVVLSTEGDTIRALALSSGPNMPEAVPAQCRFWPDSWFGATLTLFSREIASAEVTRPYTNLTHLAEVESLALRQYLKPPVTSIGEIRGRLQKGT